MQASMKPDPANLGRDQRLGELTHVETGRLSNSSLSISIPHSVPHVSHDVIQEVKDKPGDEMLKKIHSHSAYAMGSVRDAQGKLLHIRVLVDSGNLIKTGVAISEKFHKQLGVGYSQQNTGKVGTAGKGSTMLKLGKSNDFRLRIKGISKVFIIHGATVVKTLLDSINLGTGFLQTVAQSTGLIPEIKFHRNGTT